MISLQPHILRGLKSQQVSFLTLEQAKLSAAWGEKAKLKLTVFVRQQSYQTKRCSFRTKVNIRCYRASTLTAVFWELQWKFKPRTTSRGSKTHGKDAKALRNSWRRFSKTCGRRWKGHVHRDRKWLNEGRVHQSDRFIFTPQMLATFGIRLIAKNIIWCTTDSKFALSSV